MKVEQWFEVFMTHEEGDTETVEIFDTESEAIQYIKESDYQNLSYDAWMRNEDGIIFQIER